MKIKYYLGILMLTLINLPAFAASAEQQLTTLLNNMATMQANFDQIVQDERGQALQHATGEIVLKRPNKFYWNMRKPAPQTVIADGKNLWIYDKDLQQATVKPFVSSLKNTPALLLTDGNQKFHDQYNVRVATNKNNQLVFQLQPKQKETPFAGIKLFFDNNQLIKMELRDQLGQTTLIVFKTIKVNQSVNEKLFVFKPGIDVDIIGKAVR